MSKIEGKNVLITGGASGIGRLMAGIIAESGGRVILWDIDESALQNTREELEQNGGTAFGYVCNVADRNAVYQTAEKVKNDAGPVDILINNAGIVAGKHFHETPDDEIQRTMDVNIMAHFWTTKAFLPDMMERNSGHLVTIASSAGTIGVSKLSVYCASKFAAFGFDESLRMEFRKHKADIKTTVICPYFIDTGMFDGVKTRFSFLLPILKPEKVARKTIKAIKKNKHRVMMPWMVYTVGPLRILPVRVFDWISNIMGINKAMDKFKGRH